MHLLDDPFNVVVNEEAYDMNEHEFGLAPKSIEFLNLSLNSNFFLKTHIQT